MSIRSEINRIRQSRDDAFAALSEKGVSVPQASGLVDLPGLIRGIELLADASGFEYSIVYTDE